MIIGKGLKLPLEDLLNAISKPLGVNGNTSVTFVNYVGQHNDQYLATLTLPGKSKWRLHFRDCVCFSILTTYKLHISASIAYSNTIVTAPPFSESSNSNLSSLGRRNIPLITIDLANIFPTFRIYNWHFSNIRSTTKRHSCRSLGAYCAFDDNVLPFRPCEHTCRRHNCLKFAYLRQSRKSLQITQICIDFENKYMFVC